MTTADWHHPQARALAMLLPGEAFDEPDLRGRRPLADTLLVLFNADAGTAHFRLPETPGTHWDRLLDTADPSTTRGPSPGACATTWSASRWWWCGWPRASSGGGGTPPPHHPDARGLPSGAQ